MRMRRTRLYGASCTRTDGGPTNASDTVPTYGLQQQDKSQLNEA